MHKNRTIYSLSQYQAKLRSGYMNLGILIYNQSLQKSIIIRPIPPCVWISEGRNRYFKKLSDKMKFIIKSNHYTFCTLTYSGSDYTPEEAAARVKHDIDLFFKRLDYRNSKPEYFYVIELTENYMVHIHLIFDQFIWKGKVFMSWFNVTGSLCIRIQHKKKGEAIRYCLKYLQKSQSQNQSKWAFIFKNIDRIWSSSRGFFVDVELPVSDWDFLLLAWNKWNIIDNQFDNPTDDFRGHKFDPEQSYDFVDACFFNECVIETGTTDIFRILKSEFEVIPF